MGKIINSKEINKKSKDILIDDGDFLSDLSPDSLLIKERQLTDRAIDRVQSKNRQEVIENKKIWFDPANRLDNKLDKRYQLPAKVKRMFGCRNCEWYNTFECPYKFNKGQIHTDGICPKRTNHLMQFVPDHIKHTTYPVWEAYYNHGMAQSQLNKDYQIYMRLFMEYKKKADAGIEDDILLMKVRMAREDWERMLRTKLKYNEKLLDRETPKKVEMEHRLVKPTDVNDLIQKAEEAFEKRLRLEEKIRMAQNRRYMRSPREILKEGE